MMDLQTLIHCLGRTSNPLGAGVIRQSRRELTRLAEQDRVLVDIREVTALYGCPVSDLPGLIENVISNLAAQNLLLSGERNELEGILDDAFLHGELPEGFER